MTEDSGAFKTNPAHFTPNWFHQDERAAPTTLPDFRKTVPIDISRASGGVCDILDQA
jgi:hypothetical protein